MGLTSKDINKRRAAIEVLKTISIELAKKQETELDKLIKEEQDAQNGRPTFSKQTEDYLDQLVTLDSKMLELKENVRLLSPIDDTVLIIGETGTGKELIARALHGNRHGAFVPINCAAMPYELLESELFGHRRGAFTGADSDRDGLFKEAMNGTIFLDEIGDMPMQAQSKLLRALQQKAIRPVGAYTELKVNVRVVCATHHNLEQRVKDGFFRMDLFARIKIFPLITIPLRHRREDIKLIITSFDKTGKAYEGIEKQLGDNIWNNLEFPSNVRDIQAMVRQWEVLGKIL